MMFIIFILIAVFSTNVVVCQKVYLFEPDKNFTIEDGLNSNYVYGGNQDKNEFLWFYTDKGLAKFDGFSFKVFNKKQGIANEDIWFITIDSRDRIWLHAHDDILPYIKNDTVYNLERFSHSIFLYYIFEYSKDTFAFFTKPKPIYMTLNNGKPKLTILKDYNNKLWQRFCSAIQLCDKYTMDSINKSFSFIESKINGFTNGYTRVYNNCIYSISDFNNKLYVFNCESDKYFTKSNSNSIFYWPEVINGEMVISAPNQLLIFNKELIKKEIQFLDSNKVNNRSFPDKLGNIWASTRAGGIYYFNHNKIEKVINKNKFKTLVNQVFTCEDLVIIEFANNSSFVVDLTRNDNFLLSNFSGIKGIGPWFDNKFWSKGNNNIKLISSDQRVIDFHEYNLQLRNIDSSLKWLPNVSIKISNDSIITSGHHNECNLLYKNKESFYKKFLFRSSYRINLMINSNSRIYLCSNEMLYFLNKDFNKLDSVDLRDVDDGNITVSSIVDFYGDLILGTNGSGILKYNFNTNEITKIESKKNYDIIRIFKLFNYLIAHTNKGIFSYIYKDEEFKFNTVYANSYGLNPDDIKLVYPHNDSIHVVTKNSILAFSPTLIDTTRDTLKVYECFVDNQKVSMEKTVLIPHDFKQLSFRFSTFNYTRMDDTKFRYRFNSSDPWIVLSSNHIELSQLASGDYKLEIEAFNKYSNEVLANAIVPMRVLTPWYKSIWFILFANALTIGLIFYFYRRRLEQKKIVEDNIKALEYSLRESKIKLLENQMNPHFLFNSLTSIKSFIKDNDIKNADYYLGYFSKLMRLYLDSSRSSRISIHDEVELVRHYLILERMRFEDRFDFSIQVDSGLDTEGLRIPTMMIQPIVENSVRHGLFNRKSDGQLNVIIKAEEQDVLIEINDNGVGVAKSLELKSEADRSHQSHATRIIKEKIELLNNTLDYQIVVSTSELNPNDKENKGTRTIIRLKNLIE